MRTYNKLVRDRIPEIIRSRGGEAILHRASVSEFRKKLREKLKEEVKEFLETETADELADVLEVVYTFAELRGLSKPKLERVRREKKQKRGGFRQRIILEKS